MIGRLIHYLLFIAFLPIYYVGYLVPKNNRIWIFGSWNGDKYNDNPKYLFEFVNIYHPEITALWLTRNKTVMNLIREKGYVCYHPYSILGVYYSLISAVNVISVSHIFDTHFFWRQKITVNLWHGIPLKKILHDDKISGELNGNDIITKFKQILFPFLSTDLGGFILIASSESEASNLATAFKVPKSNIYVVGSPRLDVFYNPMPSLQSHNIQTVLYMPTHRGGGSLNISKLLFNELDSLDIILSKMNLSFYIKLHYYHQKEIDETIKYNAIKFINDAEINQDIYSLLPQIDILITDYSSVYFDYLLSEKPIIFAPFDIDEYLTQDRELYYHYDEVTPGPKCRDWSEVAEWISKFVKEPTLFHEERNAAKRQFHKFDDGQNSRRVYETICKLIDNIK